MFHRAAHVHARNDNKQSAIGKARPRARLSAGTALHDTASAQSTRATSARRNAPPAPAPAAATAAASASGAQSTRATSARRNAPPAPAPAAATAAASASGAQSTGATSARRNAPPAPAPPAATAAASASGAQSTGATSARRNAPPAPAPPAATAAGSAAASASGSQTSSPLEHIAFGALVAAGGALTLQQQSNAQYDGFGSQLTTPGSSAQSAGFAGTPQDSLDLRIQLNESQCENKLLKQTLEFEKERASMHREKKMLELKTYEAEKQRAHSQLQEVERERDSFKAQIGAKAELEQQLHAHGLQRTQNAAANVAALCSEKQQSDAKLQEALAQLQALGAQRGTHAETLAALVGEITWAQGELKALGVQLAMDAQALAALGAPLRAKLAEAERQQQAFACCAAADAEALAALAGEKQQADAKLAEVQQKLQVLGAQQTQNAEAFTALAGEKQQADAKLAEANEQLKAYIRCNTQDMEALAALAGEKQQTDAKLAEAERERDMFKSRLRALEAPNAVLSSNVSKCSGGHAEQREGIAMADGKKELEKLEQELFHRSQEVDLKNAVLASQREQLKAGRKALERHREDFQRVVAGISAAKQEQASIFNEIPQRLGIQIRSIDDIEKRLKYLESELSKYKSDQFKCKIMEPWSGQKKTFTEAKDKLDRAMEKARKLDDLYACLGKGGRSAPASLGQLHSELKAAHDKARILDKLYASYAECGGAAGKTEANARKALQETRKRAGVLAKVCAMIGSNCTHENVQVHVQALVNSARTAEHSEKCTSVGSKRARLETAETSKAVAPGFSAESETVQTLRALLRKRTEELATLREESSSAMAVAAYVEGHEVLRRLVHAFRTMKLADEFRFLKGRFHHQEQVLAMMQVLEDVMCRLLKVRCYFKAIAGDKNRRELAQKWMRDPNSHDLLSSVLVEKETNQVVCPLKLAQVCHATGTKVEVTDKSVSVERITLDGREMSNALFERMETYDCELQRAWTEIKLDVRAEVPALSDMLHPCPAAKNGPASAGQHAQVAVFRQELERLRSQA